MGNCGLRCRRFKNRVGNIRRKKIVLLLVGLDNAGKTTAARGLVGEDQTGIVPTVGFSALNLNHQGYAVVIYDLGGGPQIRGIWPGYYVDAHGIIFIVDSSDVSRLDESRRILEELLAHEKLSGKPVLLLANKQDKPGALDEIDLVEKLNVEGIVNKHRCPTLVETCSALSNDASKKTKDRLDPGIRNGYKWLLSMIIKEFPKFDARVEKDTLAAQEELTREKEERRKRVLQEQKRREDSENSRIIPLRDDIVEVQSISEVPATGNGLEEVAVGNKIGSSAEDLEGINQSKTRFIDLDGDEISLLTNGSNDSGLHTLVNGSYVDSGNKQSSKDTIEDEPVEEIKIERRINGFVGSVPPQEMSPVFKEYASDVRCEPPPKKSLLRKSNKTAPAPMAPLLTDVVVDRRRLPPLASPPPLQAFEIAPVKRPIPVRSISMSDDFRGSTKTVISTVEEYELAKLKKRAGSNDHLPMGDSNEI